MQTFLVIPAANTVFRFTSLHQSVLPTVSVRLLQPAYSVCWPALVCCAPLHSTHPPCCPTHWPWSPPEMSGDSNYQLPLLCSPQILVLFCKRRIPCHATQVTQHCSWHYLAKDQSLISLLWRLIEEHNWQNLEVDVPATS